MKELKQQIHENGIDYRLIGDIYFPDIELPEETRPLESGGICTCPIWSRPIPSS